MACVSPSSDTFDLPFLKAPLRTRHPHRLDVFLQRLACLLHMQTACLRTNSSTQSKSVCDMLGQPVQPNAHPPSPAHTRSDASPAYMHISRRS